MITLTSLDRQKLQIELAQFVFALAPQTLLPLDLAASPLGKSVATLRCDVTRRPESLPRLTRRGRRVFIRVGDLLDFISPQHPQPQATQRRPGRPTKAEQAAARCPHTIDILEGGAA